MSATENKDNGSSHVKFPDIGVDVSPVPVPLTGGRPRRSGSFTSTGGGGGPQLRADTADLSTSPLPSIWQDRRPASLFPETNRRARAGTMPSRWPPPIRTNHSHLGSLALMSPEGNEVLWENSGLRVPSTPGAETSPIRGETNPSITVSSAGSTTPPQMSRSSLDSFGSQRSSLFTPTSTGSSRTRSGSLSALGSSFQPFAPSIWSSPQGGSALTDTTPPPDPMQPFFSELAKSSDPQRIRSYTLNTAAVFDPSSATVPQSAPHPAQAPQMPPKMPHLSSTPGQSHPPFPGYGYPRSRAQTVGGYYGQTPGISLGRYGKQHQLLNELSDGPVVSIDDLSPVPTASLWISNVPPSATPYSLHTIFSSYGRLDAARILSLKQCAYVTFADITSAVEAQRATNGYELYPGRGPSLVGFAKILGDSPSAHSTQYNPLSAAKCSPLNAIRYLEALDASPAEITESTQLVKRALAYVGSQSDIDVPIEQHERVYVSAVLRDVRKRIDNKQMSQAEIDETALDMLPELVVLASDYMGNTVVQQLFDNADEHMKDMMLRELMPYLAQTGIHKNGTWAAQKIIDLASTPRQYDMIVEGLRPYAVPLFLDQYGNYVIQGCLKFGPPWHDFIFESIVAHLPEIAQGRFGARATRACLESSFVSRQKQRLVAAVIIEYAAQLACSSNGSILLTWLLDTCTSPARFSLLASKLAPYLLQLCTSKVGSVAVLKIITNRVDIPSSRMLIDALFDPTSEYPPDALTRILSDAVNGPTFLFKLLTSGFSENSLDAHVALNKIRMVLLQPNAVIPNHKRLLEEVGLAMLLPAEHGQERSPTRHNGTDNLTGKLQSLSVHDNEYLSYGEQSSLHPHSHYSQDWSRPY